MAQPIIVAGATTAGGAAAGPNEIHGPRPYSEACDPVKVVSAGDRLQFYGTFRGDL
jgi:hypothetical protein